MKKYVLAIPGIKWYLKNNFNIKLVSKDPGSAFWAMRCYETLKGRKLCPWLPNRPDDMAVRMRAVRASSYAQRLCSEKEEFRTSLTVKFYFSLKVCNRLVTVYLCAKCQDEWKQYFQITKKYELVWSMNDVLFAKAVAIAKALGSHNDAPSSSRAPRLKCESSHWLRGFWTLELLPGCTHHTQDPR